MGTRVSPDRALWDDAAVDRCINTGFGGFPEECHLLRKLLKPVQDHRVLGDGKGLLPDAGRWEEELEKKLGAEQEGLTWMLIRYFPAQAG